MAGKLYGLVLAGGRSSRMGQDKARLNWHGQPLYRHIISLLTQAGIGHILLSGSGFAEDLKDLPVSCLDDVLPGRGPLGGIHAAVRHLDDSDFVLAIPVDMPLMPVEAIKILARQQQTCSFSGFNLPLMLGVTKESRQVVNHLVNSDDRQNYALWRMLQQLGSQTLPTTMADYFINANTPGQWHELTKAHCGRFDGEVNGS